MDLFEPRKELGVVVRGSLSKGLEVKLDPHCSIEELRAGRFVVVEGREYDYFSMITDISLGATNPEVLDTPPDRDDALMQAVLTGTSTFGTVSLRPMIQLRRQLTDDRRQAPSRTGLSTVACQLSPDTGTGKGATGNSRSSVRPRRWREVTRRVSVLTRASSIRSVVAP